MNSSGRCETGLVRKNNEDAIFIYNTRFGCLPNIFIVADGMGGHNSGEVASESAISLFCDFIHDNRRLVLSSANEVLDMLVGGAQYANMKVYEKSLSDAQYNGMGTTFVAASCFLDKLLVINVGDSRAYIIRNDVITQITHDHTYVMELVRKGRITKDEADNHPNKNVLLRALGTMPEIEIDAHVSDFSPHDIILLCSDGLTTMLSDLEIKNIMIKSTSITDKTQDLVRAAYEKGGFDNISVILIQE